MPAIMITEATPRHVRLLGHRLRLADAREMTCLGLIPHRVLWHSYRLALLRKTALVDGDVAAMWGVAGSPLGLVGRPWLLTAPEAELVSSHAFVRIYRREVRQMLDLFPVLVGQVDATYREAVRLLDLSGFTVGPTTPFGPHGAMFRTYRMERA